MLAVISIYVGARTTVVRTVRGNSEFSGKGWHASRLHIQPIAVCDSDGEFQDALPWEVLYADIMAMIAESKELIEKLNRWEEWNAE